MHLDPNPLLLRASGSHEAAPRKQGFVQQNKKTRYNGVKIGGPRRSRGRSSQHVEDVVWASSNTKSIQEAMPDKRSATCNSGSQTRERGFAAFRAGTVTVASSENSNLTGGCPYFASFSAAFSARSGSLAHGFPRRCVASSLQHIRAKITCIYARARAHTPTTARQRETPLSRNMIIIITWFETGWRGKHHTTVQGAMQVHQFASWALVGISGSRREHLRTNACAFFGSRPTYVFRIENFTSYSVSVLFSIKKKVNFFQIDSAWRFSSNFKLKRNFFRFRSILVRCDV